MPSGGLRGIVTDGHPWAQYRAHGDPFPLQPAWMSDCAKAAEVDFPQRGSWTARALNSLALHDSNLNFDDVLRGLSPTASQVKCKDRIMEALLEAGPAPSDLNGPVALREIGGSDFLYSEMPQNLASYSYQKVKVLHTKLKPKPLLNVLPPNVASLLTRAETFVVKPDQQVAAEGGCSVRPYWDPVLRNSRAELKRLIVGLANCGLVTFRISIREKIGIFFVKKKTPEYIRMVIDCRRSNSDTRRLPARDLLHPGPIWNPAKGGGAAAYGIEADVSDCFYNFIHEQTASWFGVDFPLTTQEWINLGWSGGEIFDEANGCYFPPAPDAQLYPVFRGLCMGWSWALVFRKRGRQLHHQ